MTNVAAPIRTERDERTRAAWTTYRDELRGLDADAYEEAEAAAWDRLQSALLALDAWHVELADAGGPTR